MKVRSFGDHVQRHEKTVVIMNHRTRLDWLYFFNYLFRARVLNRQKITLKAPLKWVPMIGGFDVIQCVVVLLLVYTFLTD